MALRAGGGGPGLNGRAHHRPCPIPPPPPGLAGQSPARTVNGALRGTPGPAGARTSLPFVLLVPVLVPLGPSRARRRSAAPFRPLRGGTTPRVPAAVCTLRPWGAPWVHGRSAAAPAVPSPAQERQRAQEHLRAPLVPMPPRHARAPVGEPAEPPGETANHRARHQPTISTTSRPSAQRPDPARRSPPPRSGPATSAQRTTASQPSPSGRTASRADPARPGGPSPASLTFPYP